MILPLAILGLVDAGQANAAEKINCIDDQSGTSFSIFIPENKSTGNALVVLGNGQKFKGTFKSKVIDGMTQLAGATALDVAAYYELPD